MYRKAQYTYWGHFSSLHIATNNIAALVSKGSKVNMFADDIALYRIMKSPLDYTVLRNKSSRPSIDLFVRN